MTAIDIKLRGLKFRSAGIVLGILLFNSNILFAQDKEHIYYDNKGNISYKEKVNAKGEVVEHTAYYKSGEIKYVVPYGNKGATGVVKTYKRNGKLASETEYLNGRPDGLRRVYYGRSTHIMTFKNGKEEKVFHVINYYSNGKIKSKYFNKFFEGYGPFEENYKNGNPKIQGNFVGLKRDGEWKFYKKDGTLRRIKLYREKFVFSPRHHLL